MLPCPVPTPTPSKSIKVTTGALPFPWTTGAIGEVEVQGDIKANELNVKVNGVLSNSMQEGTSLATYRFPSDIQGEVQLVLANGYVQSGSINADGNPEQQITAFEIKLK